MYIHLPANTETRLYSEAGGKLESGRASWHSLDLKWFHLYQAEKKDIEVGDWYLFWLFNGWELMQCKDEDEANRCNNHYIIAENCYKIVATTDKTLSLPFINENLVEGYATVLDYFQL